MAKINQIITKPTQWTNLVPLKSLFLGGKPDLAAKKRTRLGLLVGPSVPSSLGWEKKLTLDGGNFHQLPTVQIVNLLGFVVLNRSLFHHFGVKRIGPSIASSRWFFLNLAHFKDSSGGTPPGGWCKCSCYMLLHQPNKRQKKSLDHQFWTLLTFPYFTPFTCWEPCLITGTLQFSSHKGTTLFLSQKNERISNVLSTALRWKPRGQVIGMVLGFLGGGFFRL